VSWPHDPGNCLAKPFASTGKLLACKDWWLDPALLLALAAPSPLNGRTGRAPCSRSRLSTSRSCCARCRRFRRRTNSRAAAATARAPTAPTVTPIAACADAGRLLLLLVAGLAPEAEAARGQQKSGWAMCACGSATKLMSLPSIPGPEKACTVRTLPSTKFTPVNSRLPGPADKIEHAAQLQRVKTTQK
jgi:hypothetical protein